jgi:opacity protein-like surface antigen
MDTSESGLALGGEGFALAASNVGYIDSAIPRTQVRFRYDSAFDDNRPDRAEFFYAKYRNIGGNGVQDPETAVNFQDYNLYVEYALNKRFSVFVEAGLEGIQPQQNPSAFGWGDSNVGFKWAFVANNNRYLTFQLKNYVPTGEGGRGLGDNHYTIEPGLLFYQKITDRLSIEGEVRDWEPIGGSDYEGNILRYGIGASYAVINNCKYRVSPVVEVVGWTVLSGKESSFVPSIVTGAPGVIVTGPGPGGPGGVTVLPGQTAYVPQGTFDINAAGDTIVNLKAGIRVDFRNRLSVYAGYGQALTGTFWYKDLVRAEIRYSF